MSVDGSQSSLIAAYKEFASAWEASDAFWNDSKREEFDQLYIASLEGKVSTASDAMSQISRLIDRVRRDCE